MTCEEALGTWQRELLGQPVDQATLAEAYRHIGVCQELCARTLGAGSDDDRLSSPEQRVRLADTYEHLGQRDEAEGDAHARAYTRLVLLAQVGKASQEIALHERAMALAAWQSAAANYHDGLRIHKTTQLAEGLERIKHKRLVAPHQEGER